MLEVNKHICPYCHPFEDTEIGCNYGFLFEQDEEGWSDNDFDTVYWAGKPMECITYPDQGTIESGYTPIIICTDKGMFLAVDDGDTGNKYVKIAACPKCRRELEP